MNEELLERYLREELRIINKHVPYRRPSLKELLSMEVPHVILRDGTIHLFNPDEIKFLASLVDPNEYESLKLPIIIEANPSYGENAYVVKDPIEAKVIAKVLGISYSVPLVIYNPQLFEIRLKLRTTTTILFMPK